MVTGSNREEFKDRRQCCKPRKVEEEINAFN